MNDINEFKKALEEYKKQVMEAPFTKINKLIEKYGSDINDDWVFMYLTAAVFFKHENLWSEGKYEEELSPINKEIDAILKKHALNSGEQPSEIDKLLKDYDDLWDIKLSDLFKEYGLKEFADFYSDNKEEYLKRYEEIKKNTVNFKLDLRQIVIELEHESKKCADVEAFNAATILIGSAIEGLMLDVAQKDRKFVKVLIDKNKKLKNKLEILSLTFSQLITFFLEAKIYPFDYDDESDDLHSSMLEVANNIRNLIHPGRKIKAKFPKNSKQEYIFLESVFLNLKSFYYS
jgi:hypothetical protein